ncbi:MAG: DeoR/GlpR family DNA-binding transcription regulator [Hespellia sp.]|nr:DeoR/GlpR family DNA-binding transcription regulator [Hespellia sp.]
MSKKNDRLIQLIEILKKQNGATIRDLTHMLDVSEMTVRRDLEELRAKNIILDIPGAAVLNAQYSLNDMEDEYQLSKATLSHKEEKEQIGKFAASLVQQDDCVIIDNGSTVEYLADNIDRDTKSTIFTCNLNILNKICNNSNISIIFGGGYYHPDTTLFESPENISLIKRIRATKVFASAAGVHDKMGVTCMNNYELELKQAIIESGAEKILLVDSSKFGTIKPCFVTNIDCFDRIITDKNITEEWIDIIRSKGIELNIVP